MKDSKLFQNLSLGPYVLQNRIVLPPLRGRVVLSQGIFQMN